MDKRAIGVFDSGLGGLTAVRELARIMPHENIIYFGDTGRIPYGTRGRDTIIKYARQDIDFLLTNDVKYIVAACGTVSSTLPRELSDALPVPYIGVVNSAAAAALKASTNKCIGILGTQATIASRSYELQLLAGEPAAKLTATACPLFVPLVENGYIEADNKVTQLVAREYLADIITAKVDTVILGCTHYPLLEDILRGILGENVALIDPGREAAQEAKRQLDAQGLACGDEHQGKRTYFVSDNVESFSALSKVFLKEYAGGECTLAEVT